MWTLNPIYLSCRISDSNQSNSPATLSWRYGVLNSWYIAPQPPPPPFPPIYIICSKSSTVVCICLWWPIVEMVMRNWKGKTICRPFLKGFIWPNNSNIKAFVFPLPIWGEYKCTICLRRWLKFYWGRTPSIISTVRYHLEIHPIYSTTVSYIIISQNKVL